MDNQTEEAVEELRRKIQSLYTLLAARTPKYYWREPQYKRAFLRWDGDQRVILAPTGKANERMPLHNLPTADLLIAVRELPVLINQVLYAEKELERSVADSLEMTKQQMRRLEQP